MTEATETSQNKTVTEPEKDDVTPAGTMAIMAILAVVILGVWLILYFGVFVPRGPVS